MGRHKHFYKHTGADTSRHEHTYADGGRHKQTQSDTLRRNHAHSDTPSLPIPLPSPLPQFGSALAVALSPYWTSTLARTQMASDLASKLALEKEREVMNLGEGMSMDKFPKVNIRLGELPDDFYREQVLRIPFLFCISSKKAAEKREQERVIVPVDLTLGESQDAPIEPGRTHFNEAGPLSGSKDIGAKGTEDVEGSERQSKRLRMGGEAEDEIVKVKMPKPPPKGTQPLDQTKQFSQKFFSLAYQNDIATHPDHNGSEVLEDGTQPDLLADTALDHLGEESLPLFKEDYPR